MLDATENLQDTRLPDAARGIVRCDHVMVSRRGISSFLWYGEGGLRGAWLVLTDAGEVRLYKGRHKPDFRGTFELIGRSPDELGGRRGRLRRKNSVYIQFGHKRRRLEFDGRDKAAPLIWKFLGAIPYVGVATDLIHAVVELVEWKARRERQRDARNAWLSILVESRPALTRSDAAAIPAAL